MIGVGLHFSIGFVFPIPFFGLTYLCLYLLLLPVSCWQSLDRLLQRSRKEQHSEPEGQLPTSSIEWPQWGIREKLTLATLCIVTALQVCFIIGRFPQLPEHIKPGALKPIASLVTDPCVYLRNKLAKPARVALGVTDHPVFMDHHFQNYKRLYAIQYKNPDGKSSFLPVKLSDGRPGAYLTGRLWGWWNWRVSGPDLSKERFELGLQKLTSFWAFKNQVSLDHADFEILSKPVQTPSAWEPGYLTEQKRQNWKVVGYVTWRDSQFTFSLKKQALHN